VIDTYEICKSALEAESAELSFELSSLLKQKTEYEHRLSVIINRMNSISTKIEGLYIHIEKLRKLIKEKE
jgi:hypothetical protein